MSLSLKNKIIPILMCGGSGSRLWPLSRESFPKQFLKCNPLSKNSFLQDTFIRLSKLDNLSDPILICNEKHRFVAAEQMREINVNPESIILEPFGRNTAPAVALGTLKAKSMEEDSILLFLPADHSIKELDAFIKTIKQGIEYAEKGNIVTFGVCPKSPESGYGYIEAENPEDFKNGKASPIKNFIEKPNKEKAKELILNSKYSWNSGIFLMRANVIYDEMTKLSPLLIKECKKSFGKCYEDLDFLRIEENSFANCPNISFDIAIMEKTKLGIVFLLDIEWSDVGCWDSISEISNKDSYGNSLIGNVQAENIKNCYLRSESNLVVGVDIEDLIVVDTSDATLILKRGSSEKIKNIVKILKNNKVKESTEHKQTFRPWGSYLLLAGGLNWQVKRINVNPGSSLSLQKHNFRTEHWIIVSGKALVEIGKEVKTLKKNESTYIPLGCKHRLSNPYKEALIIIEVQSGTYLGEDDIVRFEDIYGRENLSN